MSGMLNSIPDLGTEPASENRIRSCCGSTPGIRFYCKPVTLVRCREIRGENRFSGRVGGKCLCKMTSAFIIKELRGARALRLFCGRSSFPPPIMKPQPFSVGVFSCLIAPVPAYSCGFLRTPADFASRPNWPFRATFHSLLAIPRSDLAPWNWPEVRKGRNAGPYRSKGYARTNQAVGLEYCYPTDTSISFSTD